MAGFPTSLSIASWFVAALWIVGAVAYWLDYGADLVGLTALVGTLAAVTEWQSSKHDETQR
jgi:hypothetical protein